MTQDDEQEIVHGDVPAFGDAVDNAIIEGNREEQRQEEESSAGEDEDGE